MELFKIETRDHFQFQAYTWKVKKPLAIIQIIHGMMDHARRYDHFARWLNDHQVTVYASDHIGHGLTAANPTELGHFPRKDDWQRSIELLHMLTQRIKSEHPGIQVFLLGQSMGSVMVQTYMIQFGRESAGYILSGAIRQSRLMANIGLIIAGTQTFFFGPDYRSKLLIFLGYGQYNRKFRPNRKPYDWICTVESIVDEYESSPLCGFPCSNRFYQNLFHGFIYVSRHANLKRIPAGEPVYIFSGRQDAAGKFGKDPKKINYQLSKFARAKVQMKLYSQGRHEMLNEINREEVYSDLLEWIGGVVSCQSLVVSQ